MANNPLVRLATAKRRCSRHSGGVSTQEMSASQADSKFPSAIPFPEELRNLFLWKEKHGYLISGGFELRDHDDGSVVLWFGSDRAVGRLAIFGAGPDGSMYCAVVAGRWPLSRRALRFRGPESVCAGAGHARLPIVACSGIFLARFRRSLATPGCRGDQSAIPKVGCVAVVVRGSGYRWRNRA